jgi:hypothetical protein
MKNLTVSLDDETYRRARMIAAQRDTSVSALVKRFLLDLASGESETERLKRQEQNCASASPILTRPTGFPATIFTAAAPSNAAFHRHEHLALLDQPKSG